MTEHLLAAIHFGDGQDIDELLGQIAERQMAHGKRVVGALQKCSALTAECHCSDMDLITIGSGEVFRISQPLGAGSSGCRLHPGTLAECSAFLEAEFLQGCDLLIVNRFGKGESDGRGFRDLIALAVTRSVPVLTAVRSTYAASWQSFCGDQACDLPFDGRQVDAWIANCHRRHQAA